MLEIDLSDESVLVTGGAGAIGAATARIVGMTGATVTVADLRLDRAESVAAGLRDAGIAAEALQVDLTDSESVGRCVRRAREATGVLTGVVNAGGVWSSAASEEMTDQMWSDMMGVNLTGVFRACRAAVPELKTAGRGSIVNISSVAAFSASAESAPYSATKAGVIGYTIGLAGELAPYGIRANTICPGWVDGGFTHQALAASAEPAALRALANSQHLLGRMATPDDIAHAAVWLLSPFASFVTGTSLLIDGGFMAKH